MHEINVPRESANDNDVLVVNLNYQDGDWVPENSVVASLEGEKIVYDVVSPVSGFIYHLAKAEEKKEIDSILAVLSEDPVENIAEIQERYRSSQEQLVLKDVQYSDNLQRNLNFKVSSTSIHRIAVIGAGRGLDQIIDAAIDCKSIKIISAYDDVKFARTLGYSGIPIIGPVNFEQIIRDYADGLFDALLISISTNIAFRKKCFDMLSRNIPFANLIHRTASVSNSSIIGIGNIILANTVIGNHSKIGSNNFISAMCNIEHHCRVGDHCTFGPGVVFSGGVEVCDEVKFGTGIFAEPFYSIERKTFVKSGSILTVDFSERVRTKF